MKLTDLTVFNEFINRNVTIEVAHLDQGSNNKITDATHQLKFLSAKNDSNVVALEFSNDITLRIPVTASCDFTTKSNLIIQYTSKDKSIILTITPHISEGYSKQVIKAPFVKELKDANGNIVKIIASFPPENISQAQLTTIMHLLKEIFLEWNTFHFAKRSGGEINYLYKYLQFVNISEFSLPGESFLQCLCNYKGEEVTLDIPTSFIINMKSMRMTFEFDSVQYELSKVA